MKMEALAALEHEATIEDGVLGDGAFGERSDDLAHAGASLQESGTDEEVIDRELRGLSERPPAGQRAKCWQLAPA